MIRALAFLASICAPSLALAADSTWLWCHGSADRGGTRTHFAASILEHRAPSGDARELSVMLVYGDHASRGTVAKNSKLTTKNIASAHVVFTGTGKLDNAMTTFALDGDLDTSFGDSAKPTTVAFTATLTCETLD